MALGIGGASSKISKRFRKNLSGNIRNKVEQEMEEKIAGEVANKLASDGVGFTKKEMKGLTKRMKDNAEREIESETISKVSGLKKETKSFYKELNKKEGGVYKGIDELEEAIKNDPTKTKEILQGHGFSDESIEAITQGDVTKNIHRLKTDYRNSRVKAVGGMIGAGGAGLGVIGGAIATSSGSEQDQTAGMVEGTVIGAGVGIGAGLVVGGLKEYNIARAMAKGLK